MKLTALAIKKHLSSTSLKEKIGEGRYREVYRFEDKALKILKPTVAKKYGPFKLNLPSRLYTLSQFGINNFNEFEYEIYNKFEKRVPLDFKKNFATIYEVGEIEKKSISLSELVLNEDGSLSIPLSNHTQIKDEHFWHKIDEIEKLLIKQEIMIMDIRGENLLVRETNGCKNPVLIDYKRYGKRTCLRQLIFSKAQLIKKINRRFQKLKELYRPKDN